MSLLTRRRFTADEYQRMGAAGILGEDDRVELIEGEIVEMSPIGSSHAGHVMRLTALLHGLAAGRAIVSVQNPVVLGEDSQPQPDLALLRMRRSFYTDRHPGPADVLLLVEVSDSSADYDRTVKVPLYARFGIPAVWLLDLAAPDGIEVYGSPGAQGFTQVHRVCRGGTLTVPGLPGTEVAVDEVLGS